MVSAVLALVVTVAVVVVSVVLVVLELKMLVMELLVELAVVVQMASRISDTDADGVSDDT